MAPTVKTTRVMVPRTYGRYLARHQHHRVTETRLCEAVLERQLGDLKESRQISPATAFLLSVYSP
jgi:hypothetical protein